MIPQKIMESFAAQEKKMLNLSQQMKKSEAKVADNAQRGVKYPYTAVDSVFFDEGVQSEQQLTISIPAAHGVYIERIAIYPSFRFFTTDAPTNGPDEISYRPCVFSSGENVCAPRVEADSALLDLRVRISETFSGIDGRTITRDLQNGPIPSKLFYTDAINYRTNNGRPLSGFDHGKGLYLVEPWFLPNNSTITFRISPVLASIREDLAVPSSDETRKNQYKVDVVLDGYKRDNR